MALVQYQEPFSRVDQVNIIPYFIFTDERKCFDEYRLSNFVAFLLLLCTITVCVYCTVDWRVQDCLL